MGIKTFAVETKHLIGRENAKDGIGFNKITPPCTKEY